MTKPPIPLAVQDLSQFARALARQLGETGPSHLTLMNMLARAAGFQNMQHMRAAAQAAPIDQPLPKPDAKLVERALMQFDDQGRLRQWPAKRMVQTLALWALFPVVEALALIGWVPVAGAFVAQRLLLRERSAFAAMTAAWQGLNGEAVVPSGRSAPGAMALVLIGEALAGAVLVAIGLAAYFG